MGKPLIRGVVSLAFMFAFAAAARAAEDAFFDVPFDKLPVIEGTMPGFAQDTEVLRKRALLPPYVVLDGAGEAYANLEETSGANTLKSSLFVRAPAGQEVKGRLYLPNDDGSTMVVLKPIHNFLI